MSRIAEIEAAIATADAKRCLAALRGATEAERKQMAPRVIELSKWDSAVVLSRDYDRRLARSAVAVLALYGTAPLGQIKRAREWVTHHPLFPVLEDRKPSWLSEWVNWTLSLPATPYFEVVLRLIRSGMVAKPASDDYVRAVIVYLAPGKDIRKLLAKHPDVFAEDLWRFFEVEGGQSDSLASVDKYGGGWKEGLVTLASAGAIDRGRLLDASLDALERDFAPFRAAWFSSLHEALEPAPDEAAARAERYLGLLGSRSPSTVSFAMKAVTRLDKAGRIEAHEVCSMIGPALSARQKGVVSEALKVLSRIARTEPGLAPRVAEAVTPALAHESPEIQKAALDLMDRCGAASDAVNSAMTLAPTQRARLGVTVVEEEAPLPERPEPAAVRPIRDLDELVEAFAAVLEREEPPIEMERVLDGVSRLCGARPQRFDALTAPLAARAEKLPGAVLSPLLKAWTRGIKPERALGCAGLISFLWARVDEAAARSLARRGAPLVGVPSHSDGSLDPAVFLDRLRENPEPGPLDLIQALLRLSPAHRQQALTQAKKIPGEKGKAIRYALGSAPDTALPDDPLWTAAAQARDPRANAPGFELRWRKESRSYAFGGEQEHLLIGLETTRELSRRIGHPGDLTANPGTQDAAMLRWCATVWPWNREGFYAAGAQVIARNLDWWAAEWGNRVYLETLAADPLPYGPMGLELLALGLACKDNGEAMAASDALVAALSDGRVTGKTLGAACARLATHGKITISRWTKRLGAAARIRRSFANELFTVQDRLLAASAPIGSNEMSGFLELLCELRAQSGLDLSREARLRLERAAPGGKSAKLAKSLL